MYDVLVIGAGVAGSATAIDLARRGRSVLLVDKAAFPRRKACGEGLFPRGVAELAELGVLPELTDASTPLETVRFTIGGCSVEAAVGSAARPALGVQRLRLDAALLSRAEAEGVEVRCGVEVRQLTRSGGGFGVEADGEVLESQVIVAADGARSGLRRQAGLDGTAKGRRYGVSAHLTLAEAPPPRIDVHFGDGYEVYVTPVGGSVVNVAVLLDRSRMNALGGRLTEGYLALVSGSGALAAGYELIDEPLAVGPFPAAARTAWRDNLVLVGDAAGFFDGISGEGMTLALVSARQAAAAIDAALATGSEQPLRQYDQRRRTLARNSTLLARLSLALASRPGLGRRAVRNLNRRPETFARLVAINSGELGLGALRPRDLWALAFGV